MKSILIFLIFVVLVKSNDIRHIITQQQSVSLGQQFNAITGQLLNHHVWNEDTIKRFRIDCSKDISENRYRVQISTGTADTLSKLAVSAYAKISIASGLIEVSGSASFMKQNKRHSKSNFLFATQTVRNGCERFDSTNYGNPDVDKFNDHATHVVTEIHRGGDATLTFERKLQGNEDEQRIAGKLDIAIKKFPGINIGGGGELELTDEEKSLLENISIDYSGDFTINNNPTDYNEAIKVVQSFSANLRNISVPKVIILTPIKYIQSRLNRVYHDIENHIVEQFAQRAELKMRLDNIFDDLIEFKPFVAFRQSIIDTKLRWVKHTTKFLDDSQGIIKAIRARKAPIQELTKLLYDSTEQGEFTFSKVESWLQKREQELLFLSKIFNDFQKLKIERRRLDGQFSSEDKVEFYLQFNNVITPGISDITSTFVPRSNSDFSRRIYYYMKLNHLKLSLFFDDKTDMNTRIGEINTEVTKKVGFKQKTINLFEMHYMFEGEIRGEKDYLVSENCLYYAGIPNSFMGERKFVVNRINENGNDVEIWNAKFNVTVNGGDLYLILKEDGNLIVENRQNGRQPRTVWESKTNGRGKTPFTLILDRDGDLVLEDYDWNIVWRSSRANPQNIDIMDNILIDLNYETKKLK